MLNWFAASCYDDSVVTVCIVTLSEGTARLVVSDCVVGNYHDHCYGLKRAQTSTQSTDTVMNLWVRE
jgi:hypothetical protein